MKKAKYNRVTGNMSSDYIDQQKELAKLIADKTQGNNKPSGSLWWERLINNAEGWLDSIGRGVSSSIAAKNQPDVVDNTPLVLAIAGVGVAAVVLIIALLIIFKK